MEPQVIVNGRAHVLRGTGTLLDWLRGVGLTGCKEGCAEGECGACAVLVNRPDGPGRSRWTAINACLVPAAALAGQEVVTAEGLGTPDDLHPVQHEMAVRGGSQCGFCTPGFVCSMAAEYYRPERGADGFELEALSGNLCRCTGYRPIRDAAYALGAPPAGDPLRTRLDSPAPTPQSETLAQVLERLAADPGAKLVAGSTDWGVEVNLAHARADTSIAIDQLAELRELTVGPQRIQIGAALTLSEIERGLGGAVPLLDQLIPQFASRLIRNSATLGGNLGTASPIGDAPPALLALDASLVLASRDGEREVPLSDYFTGYRQTVLRPGELIRAVRIPLPLAPVSAFHKIAKRRFDDISSVAIGYAMELTGDVVTTIRIGLGGVAATPIRGRATEEFVIGRPWAPDTVAAAAEILGREGTPLSDHRASAAYRRAMLQNSLLKFHAENPAPSLNGQVSR